MIFSYMRHELETALRAAGFDRSALHQFDDSLRGFFYSFLGIFLCAPLYVLVLLAERRITDNAAVEMPSLALAPLPPANLAFAALESANYLANWVLFPLAMIFLANIMGAGKRYVPFVVAYNWTGCIILAATVLPYLLYLARIVPIEGVMILYYPVIFFAFALRWTVARDTLKISGLNAAGIVIFDFLLSILMAVLVGKLREGLVVS
ncbi:MAG: hypothetical protein RJB62_736 [Pseudomonadota bacterium]|jgi:hypothetical protein